MPYAPESYTEILCWQEDTPISYVPHGKKAGTKSYDRYLAYSEAKTVGEALELGSKPLDLVNDFEKRILKRVGGPVRESPLNLLEVQDTSTLSKTDLTIARWGYQISRGEKSGEGGDMSQVKAFRKALTAAQFGVQAENIVQEASRSETSEMIAKRSRANAEAATVLEEAAEEGRKINDDDVLRVLRLWAIKKNLDRKSVFPEGVKFVYSETMGLKNCSFGKILTTLHTKQYPKVLLLLTRWMKDNRPEGHSKDFPFTTIIVNRGFAARRHRNAVNIGPTVVKSFGNCKGGRLRYWADDDKSSAVDDLLDKDAITLDQHSAPAVIDGNRAHAVEPYTGDERFSVVFFTVHSYETASAEDRNQLMQVGFPFPDEASAAYAKSLLPAPAGYAASGDGPKAPKVTSEAKKAISFLKGLKKQKQKHGPLLSKMMALRQAIKPPAAPAPSGSSGAAAAASESKPEQDEPMAPATESPESSTTPTSTGTVKPAEQKPKLALASRGLLARVLAKRAGGENAASLSAPKLKPSRAPKKPKIDGSLMFKAQKRTLAEVTARDEGSTEAVESSPVVKTAEGNPAKAAKAEAKTLAKDTLTPEPKRRRDDSAKQQQMTLTAEKSDLRTQAGNGDLKNFATTSANTEKSSADVMKTANATMEEVPAAVPEEVLGSASVVAQRRSTDSKIVLAPAAGVDSAGPSEEGKCHEFLSFAKVLSLAAGDTSEASDTVANFLTKLTRGTSKSDAALRSAMVLMEPTSAIPARAIAAGITKAFGVLCEPNVLGEVLAAEALQGRRSTPGPEPGTEPLAVVEVAAVLAMRSANTETEEEWQAVVEEVAKLLARTRQGMEPFFVVLALQGKLAPRRDVAQCGIAKAMVGLSGC